MVAQPGFEGTLGELAYSLRNGTIAPAAIDLLVLVKTYLRHFDELAARNLELASVALPAVARVIELKLRLLLPRPPVGDDEEEGVEELEITMDAIAMLEELEDAIAFLRQRRDERRIVMPAMAPRPDYPRPERPVGTGIEHLAQLASRYRGGGYFEFTVDRLSMSGAMEQLLGWLRRWRRALLHEASDSPDWPRLTVFFAGMLELVREGRIEAVQHEPYGEIELELVGMVAAEVA